MKFFTNSRCFDVFQFLLALFTKDQGSRIKDSGRRKAPQGEASKTQYPPIVRSSAPTHSSLNNEFLSSLIISSGCFCSHSAKTRDLNTLVLSTKEWEIRSSPQNFQDVTFHMSESLQAETLDRGYPTFFVHQTLNAKPVSQENTTSNVERKCLSESFSKKLRS